MSEFYLRNPRVSCVARGEHIFFVEDGAVVCEVGPVDVDGLSVILQELSLPVYQEKTRELIEDEALAVLLRHKVLLTGTYEELSAYLPKGRREPLCKSLVVGVTGAVPSMHASSLLFDLYHNFAESIDVIFTESSKHFTQPEVLPYLGINAWTDAFQPKGEVSVPHIHLATRAEMIVVFPASAHTLYKLAHGACSDLLSLTVAATKAPVVLIPAMDDVMWSQPAIKRNVRQLRRDGFYVVEPALGVDLAKRRESYRDYGDAGIAGSLTKLLRGLFLYKKST